MYDYSRRQREPKLCTTKSRYEEFSKIQISKHHHIKAKATLCSSTKPRKLGKMSELLVVQEADRQCSQEVHGYLRELFDEAKKMKHDKVAKHKPILSARTAPVTKQEHQSMQRVTFSAFGLPEQRLKIKKTYNLRPGGGTPPTVHKDPYPQDQRVFIKLTRPSTTSPSSEHVALSDFSSVKKQTFRPFCLIKGCSVTDRRCYKMVQAPPSSPQFHDTRVPCDY